ncbi:MAG: FAD-binding oxidoreductase, partial [Rubrobacteraceae bacterium]|nr:FAD-binding oxidoreductase [Rubrobacteraceae bacterium]
MKVAVVGAGIVGSSVAYRLSEGDAEVVLIDGAEPGSG